MQLQGPTLTGTGVSRDLNFSKGSVHISLLFLYHGLHVCAGQSMGKFHRQQNSTLRSFVVQYSALCALLSTPRTHLVLAAL